MTTLADLARAAHREPWDMWDRASWSKGEGGQAIVAGMWHLDPYIEPENAALAIACSPERILALLAVVEAGREHGICTCRYYPGYPRGDRHAPECDDDLDLTAALDAALDALEAGT